jgi:hypothetical protein
MMRCTEILKYQLIIIQKIYEKNKIEIENGKYSDFKWRWEMYENTSYLKLMLLFWISPKKIYKEDKILS